jgi:arsenate reductase (glutaredoxin)
MKETGTEGFEIIDIKQQHISAQDLAIAAEQLGGYLALFNMRAQKIKAMGIDPKSASEAELKQWILDEYTFLKRPVYFIENEVFAGNSKSTTEDIKAAIH